MSQIRITPQELRDGANSITKVAEAVSENLQTLKSLVDSVANNWEGAAQTSYVASFDELYNEFKETFPTAITGLADQMTAITDTMEQTDADIAKAFSGQ